MVASTVDGIDPFKITGRTISGWIPRLKTDTVFPLRQPFCSYLKKRLLLWLEYHPQMASYARSGIRPVFAKTYRLSTSKDTPFAIGYTFLPEQSTSTVGSIIDASPEKQRKTCTPNTDQQWARRETSWEVVGGESK